ncbi:MAG: hypothetical protein EDM82_07255 [Cyanobacteria bacterium CYA]|nr:MAG: hypothetical protein EDM82_07255 [Cyanobacteria bacterium CYA]
MKITPSSAKNGGAPIDMASVIQMAPTMAAAMPPIAPAADGPRPGLTLYMPASPQRIFGNGSGCLRRRGGQHSCRAKVAGTVAACWWHVAGALHAV